MPTNSKPFKRQCFRKHVGNPKEPWTMKYPKCKSKAFRYPFKMENLVNERKITIKQREKYMKMLNSEDDEMEELAITILRKLNGYE